MLHALAGMSVARDWRLAAAHLNHGFRGQEAEEDADYVAALCDSLGIACRSAYVDVPARAKRRHQSAQEAAREVRHAFLRQVADETGATRIALGHTRSDRVETILINLLRGAGAEGLSGFPPSDGLLVRPLFDSSRAQILSYCEDFDLRPRIDSSNAHLDYIRNRIRTELLPQLVSYYNERVEDALLRMSELISADHVCLESQAVEQLRRIALIHGRDLICFSCASLDAIPLALRRRVLRQAILEVREELRGISFERVEGLLEAAALRRSFGVTLPLTSHRMVRMGCDAETVRIERLSAPSSQVPWQTVLQTPGRTFVPGIGAEIEIISRSGTEKTDPLIMGEKRMLLPAGITLPLIARSRKPGDRVALAGQAGHKKLQDLFVDAHIPRSERDRMPVIVDAEGHVLGVPGLTPRTDIGFSAAYLLRQIAAEEPRV